MFRTGMLIFICGFSSSCLSIGVSYFRHVKSLCIIIIIIIIIIVIIIILIIKSRH
jgi:hypothetical protein